MNSTAMATKSPSPSPLLHHLFPQSKSDLVVTLLPTFNSSSSLSSSAIRAYRGNVPKLEPFSRSKMDRALPDPPLIEKSLNQIADYCSNLEGDDASSGWQAYFELRDLQRRVPEREVETLIHQAGGVKTLISYLHSMTPMYSNYKAKPEEEQRSSASASAASPQKRKEVKEPCPIPDGLPRPQEEIDEEEEARMPDTPHTRLLRARSKLPAWFTLRPDHETD
ncbi:CCG-binding protein 1 [Linum perenne]